MDESPRTPFFCLDTWYKGSEATFTERFLHAMLFTSFASFPFKYMSSEFSMKKMGLLLKSSNHNCSYVKSG